MTDRRWYASIPCYGLTELFYGPPAERPEAHRKRVAKARKLCMTCQHRAACDQQAGRNDETGVWAAVERHNMHDLSRQRRNQRRTQETA